MKKILSSVFVLVLTAVLFTGCGCTRKDAQYTTASTTMTMPTILPTAETTVPTTEAATTHPTADRGNGPAEDTTGNTTIQTEETASEANGRSRSMR